MNVDRRTEYQSRLSDWSKRAEALEASHSRLGNLRLLFVVGVLALAAVLCRSEGSWGAVLLILLLGLLLTGVWHVRIENARNAARRGIRFYQSGLERLDGTWSGKGSPGTEFLDPHHPYAADLDLFGVGSLFELVNAAHTQTGRATLAAWLLEPASLQDILARQEAIKELSPKVDLRERLGFVAAEVDTWIPTESLISWTRQPRTLKSNPVRVVAFCLPWLSVVLLIAGQWLGVLSALTIQYALARFYRRRVQKVTRTVGVVQHDLRCIADLFECLEAEDFKSERLRRMDAVGPCSGVCASEAIQRLATFYSWIASRGNPLVAIVGSWFLWETQVAFAVEAGVHNFGTMVRTVARRLGEIEALSSVAGTRLSIRRTLFQRFCPLRLPHRSKPKPEASADAASPRCVARCVAWSELPADRGQRLQHVRQEHLSPNPWHQPRAGPGRSAGARAEVSHDACARRRVHSDGGFHSGRNLPLLCGDHPSRSDREAGGARNAAGVPAR